MKSSSRLGVGSDSSWVGKSSGQQEAEAAVHTFHPVREVGHILRQRGSLSGYLRNEVSPLRVPPTPEMSTISHFYALSNVTPPADLFVSGFLLLAIVAYIPSLLLSILLTLSSLYTTSR